MNKCCEVVTIESVEEIYYKGSPATKIEQVTFKENGFKAVVPKGDYPVGSEVLFLNPDFLIGDTIVEYSGRVIQNPIFQYVDKNKLGKKNRIRAVKMAPNITSEYAKTVYSYGIVLPLSIVPLKMNLDYLDTYFNLSKEDEELEGSLPSYLYATDETNINNLWNTMKFPMYLVGTEKVDGSSITITMTGPAGNKEFKVYSRKILIPETITRQVDRKLSFIDKIFISIKEKCVGYDKKDYYAYIQIPNDSIYLKTAAPYIERIKKVFGNSNTELAFRGELVGKGVRGSGNSHNPHGKDDTKIIFFGVDSLDTGMAVRHEDYVYRNICKVLGFETCRVLSKRNFRCKGDVVRVSEDIFKKEAKNGNLIEGIVYRTLYGEFSAKYMSLEYDSKK